MALPIVFMDEQIVAIHKPSGLLVHRSMLDRHETRFAVQLLRDQLGRRVYPAHRLDKGTSGLLLFGLNPEAGRALSLAFEHQHVHKRYHAIVRGWPSDAGVIDHALAKQLDESEIRAGAPQGPIQDAVTEYKTLATTTQPWQIDKYPESRYALVELNPITGRRHQLRRHLKHISHPIIGDATYGKGQHNRKFAEVFGHARLLLACSAMRFPHPVTGETLALTCPLAADFGEVVHGLGWAIPDDLQA
ncbi:pseudouridine synthase [Amantichitinum ursilacus]|uniref:tRNA pseudouridine synthase C n=1 Tax=Amantichitinum ursilacus TaxID=857265 RepID=A0A0N0GPG8_9NEIS|nr:pseudouridine synthase [Amantichitinum ursilacus]KPC53468.1 tRNA pseudouridine synthase C [Amantichitinum ursilacus]